MDLKRFHRFHGAAGNDADEWDTPGVDGPHWDWAGADTDDCNDVPGSEVDEDGDEDSDPATTGPAPKVLVATDDDGNGYITRPSTKDLDIQDFNINYISPLKIAVLAQLVVLQLQNKCLTSLPEELGSLSRLQHLNLNRNRLTDLPRSLKNLRDLYWLNVGENHFTDIPAVIKAMTNLRNLNLAGNTAVGAKFTFPANWRGLQVLRIGQCNQTRMSRTLRNLSRLNVLSIRGNRYSSNFQDARAGWVMNELPRSISGLLELKHLNCSNCRLTELPKWLGQLDNLKTLNLSQNRLEKIPVSRLRPLGRSLKKLSLSSNRLTSVPRKLMSALPNLESLCLEDNPMLLQIPQHDLEFLRNMMKISSHEEAEETQTAEEGEMEVTKPPCCNH